jgi:hypothetical protein
MYDFNLRKSAKSGGIRYPGFREDAPPRAKLHNPSGVYLNYPECSGKCGGTERHVSRHGASDKEVRLRNFNLRKSAKSVEKIPLVF